MFTQNNTAGFTNEQLAQMNAELDALNAAEELLYDETIQKNTEIVVRNENWRNVK